MSPYAVADTVEVAVHVAVTVTAERGKFAASVAPVAVVASAAWSPFPGGAGEGAESEAVVVVAGGGGGGAVAAAAVVAEEVVGVEVGVAAVPTSSRARKAEAVAVTPPARGISSEICNVSYTLNQYKCKSTIANAQEKLYHAVVACFQLSNHKKCLEIVSLPALLPLSPILLLSLLQPPLPVWLAETGQRWTREEGFPGSPRAPGPSSGRAGACGGGRLSRSGRRRRPPSLRLLLRRSEPKKKFAHPISTCGAN